jgi:hypothetical protein
MTEFARGFPINANDFAATVFVVGSQKRYARGVGFTLHTAPLLKVM